MKATTGVAASQVGQGAQHCLYVEGEHAEGLDPRVLAALTAPLGLRVEPLGPSQHIRAVARALQQSHAHYYFVVDRDHHTHAEVEASWRDFLDPAKGNLLIWRRRELENYFIEPKWLARSAFLRPDWSEVRLAAAIQQHAAKRIYLDCANLVITRVREDQKANWVKLFKAQDLPQLDSAHAARRKLCALPAWTERQVRLGEAMGTQQLAVAFDKQLAELLGGAAHPQYGSGNWLHMVAGKELFEAIANEAFQVVNGNRATLQGKPACNLLARERVFDATHRPADFDELAELLGRAIRAAP